MDINNKCTVLISGGASGMGAATARMLAGLGANIAILDINGDAAKSVAAEVRGIGLACDITHTASIEAALEQIDSQFGSARVCINCAGIVTGRRIVSQQGPMPLEEFKHVIDVNLIGTFNLMRLAAAAMTKLDPIGSTQERGVIINTASIAAFDGQIGQAAYSASKGGLVSLTLPAARELAAWGIRVMAIAPGLVDTPMLQKISPEARAALVQTLVFPKRLAYPEEYAKLVLQIIDNPMLNGEVIRLDGALRMQPK